MAKSQSLAKIADSMKVNFNEVVQQRYLEKYADDALKLLEEYQQLKKAVEQYETWIKRLDEGDYTALKSYKKYRTKLEREDGYEV